MKSFFSKIVNTVKDIDGKVEHISNAYEESTRFNKSNYEMDFLR